MNFDVIAERTAKRTGIYPEDVKKIYRSYWKFVFKTMTSKSLEDIDSKEKMMESGCVVRIKGIGTFHPDYKFVKRKKEIYGKINKQLQDK